jgi:hypothetical protein
MYSLYEYVLIIYYVRWNYKHTSLNDQWNTNTSLTTIIQAKQPIQTISTNLAKYQTIISYGSFIQKMVAQMQITSTHIFNRAKIESTPCVCDFKDHTFDRLAQGGGRGNINQITLLLLEMKDIQWFQEHCRCRWTPNEQQIKRKSE